MAHDGRHEQIPQGREKMSVMYPGVTLGQSSGKIGRPGRRREMTQQDKERLLGHNGVTLRQKDPEAKPKNSGERLGGTGRVLEPASAEDSVSHRKGEGDVMDFVCAKDELLAPGPLVYPCRLSDELEIWLDQVCTSMHYLWFPLNLAQDMVLIRIQKICRETQTSSGGRIHIDNGCIEQGRIVIRINLAEPDDGGKAFWRAIADIVWVLCTTTSLEERGNFLSDLENFSKKSQR